MTGIRRRKEISKGVWEKKMPLPLQGLPLLNDRPLGHTGGWTLEYGCWSRGMSRDGVGQGNPYPAATSPCCSLSEL